jgi:predicted ATPase
MLITISGAQGQGKSTVLNSLEKLGYNIVPRKTSRSILSDWGMTLNEVNKYAPLTKRFQEEIIVRQQENDASVINSSSINFSERSYADIFSYCLNIIGPFNEYTDWLNGYFDRCKKLQQNYDCVIYLSGRKEYVPEDDGVRSINQHFTKMIDIVIKSHIQAFDNGNVLYVDTPDHEKRISMIVEHIQKLELKRAHDMAVAATVASIYANTGNPHA